jgi:hypothetical protein
MTAQEMLDHNVRLTIGDLTVQILALKVRITELETQVAQALPLPEQPPVIRPNGAGEEAIDGRHGT